MDRCWQRWMINSRKKNSSSALTRHGGLRPSVLGRYRSDHHPPDHHPPARSSTSSIFSSSFCCTRQWAVGSSGPIRLPSCPYTIHKGLHFVELGCEISQTLLQGVELTVKLSKGVRQRLDPEKVHSEEKVWEKILRGKNPRTQESKTEWTF